MYKLHLPEQDQAEVFGADTLTTRSGYLRSAEIKAAELELVEDLELSTFGVDNDALRIVDKLEGCTRFQDMPHFSRGSNGRRFS